MPENFREVSLERAYRSSSHRLSRDFYGLLLTHASQYRRAAGFFASTVFSVALEAHLDFFRRGGRIEIVSSDVLRAQDADQLVQAVYDRPRVRARWKLETVQVGDVASRESWPEFLAWLVAADLVTMRIARLVLGGPSNLYHEKIGIFYDRHAQLVAFSGSSNETEPGYVSNFERVDVFASFNSDTERRRALAIEQHFLDLWNNRTPGVEVVPLHVAIERGLLRVREETNGLDAGPAPSPRRPSGQAPEALFAAPGLELHRHQREAIRRWASMGGRGILEMATGSGKTITALSLASQLYDSLGSPLVILIIAPLIHLVDQWIAVASTFGLHPIRCAEGTDRWFDDLSVAIQASNAGHRPVLSIATTAATLASDPFQRLLLTIRKPLLVIGDEVHTYGAPVGFAALPKIDSYRVGLSATPERAMDPEGSQRLRSYFGPVVFEYTLRDALRDEVLTPYRYYPVLLDFDPDEMEEFVELTRRIARLGRSDDDSPPSEPAKRLLIKRARLVASARAKLPKLRALLASRRNDAHILVYCGDGAVEQPDGPEMVRQVEEAVRIVGAELGMTCASYTANTPATVRQQHLQAFSAGDLQVLVAIRCLDEGVDVPATRTAFLLASSTNPRQFVQRRGRVLRRAPGKYRADIHDFFVVPDPANYPKSHADYRAARSLVRSQLARSQEFADLAENGPTASGVLRPVRDHFDLLTEG